MKRKYLHIYKNENLIQVVTFENYNDALGWCCVHHIRGKYIPFTYYDLAEVMKAKLIEEKLNWAWKDTSDLMS